MAIYRGEGGAGDATADASNAAALADAFADAANASAGQAATSAAAAEAAKLAAQAAQTAAELAETNAETAETNAEAAEAAAALLLDQFDDRYLGAKSADPAFDNDGNALLDGAIYWNTVDTALRVYDLGSTTWFNTIPDTADQAAINTVSTNIADVNSVADNILDVTAVADNETNIDAVAANATNINTVAGISGNVTTVAGISASVSTVANNDTNVTTVATDIANVNAVGTNIANVNAVAGNATNINAVNANKTNIDAVAGNNTNITAVAGNATNINAVNANATNINTVAGINANVTTVAGISGNVTTVATNNANVTTVAGSIANVNTNATNIANINQNAANIVAIQNASANATAAASSATAAAGSATSASASAAAASAVALGNEPVRHSVRPSLLLDFANTKTLDPRITFTRASTASFYDGKTVAKAEENLLLQTVNMANAVFLSTNIGTAIAPVRTANYGVAPDGTTTAARYELSLNGGTSTGDLAAIRQSYNFGAAVTASYSVYIKSTDGTSTYEAQIVSPDGLPQPVTITGTWTRFTITGTSQTIAVVYGVRIRGGQTPTNSDTADILVWGAQLEQRSSVTAYTATTTAPITNYIPALQTAASGVARFEHNPVTGESLGLEIEEQRTNLVTYSDDLANAAWTKVGASVTSNVLVSPDGTLTSDKLVEDTSTGSHRIEQNGTTTITNPVTFSVFAKAAERNQISLQIVDNGTGSNGGSVYFNLSTGVAFSAAVDGSGAGASATITAVGNGWYRCSFTVTTNGSGTAVRARTYLSTTGTTRAYTGDGYSGVYIWGAQLEAGAFATSYIPTVASQVTRSADVAQMTGTNFSSWYRADEGTLYADFVANTAVVTGLVFQIDNGADANRNSIGVSGTSVFAQKRINGNASNQTLTVTNGAVVKISNAITGAERNSSINGSTVNTGSLNGYVNATVLRIGNQVSAGGVLNSTIKKLAYYPKRLANEELVSLSTI